MAIYEKPYMFNIVLNSQQSSTFSTGTNDETYLFNWTNIKPARYRVAMYWKGKNNADYVGNDCPQVFITIGTVPNVYQAKETDGSHVSFFAGSLRPDTHAGGQICFVADGANHNAEFYYDAKPLSNQIRVQVFRDDFITPFTTIAGSPLADYVCVLYFKEIK